MQLIYADQVYASIEAACKTTAPLFYEKLVDACDYAKSRPEYPVLNGHFDGARGWAMLMIHLAPKVRTREDREFYNTARDLQKKHHLPDNCSVKLFRDKALAFATKINPGLVQKYTGEDAGVYILELLPRGLAADMRRLETQLRAAGELNDLNVVIEECCNVVAAETKPSRESTAVALPPALAVYDAAASSHYSMRR